MVKVGTGIQVGVVCGGDGLGQEVETVPEGQRGQVGAPELQDVEGVEPEAVLRTGLEPAGLFGAGGQDRRGGLEGVTGDGPAGVEGGAGEDQLAVQDGAVEAGEAGRQVGQVVLELAQAVGDLADVAAGDADSVALDVQEGPDPVQLGLDDPAGFVVFDASGVLGLEVGPVAQEHGGDLGRERLAGVVPPPVVVPQGGDVGLFARTTLGCHTGSRGRHILFSVRPASSRVPPVVRRDALTGVLPSTVPL